MFINKKERLNNIKKILFLLLSIAVIYYGFTNVDSNKYINDVKNVFTEEIELDEHIVNVVRVIDGDTIVIKMENGKEETVRLLLIDTPESVHPTEPEQIYGEESSDFAKSKVKEGDTIKIEVGNPERDKYERLLAYVWLDDINFNELMIKKGYARVGYIYEPNTKYLNDFRKAEDKAKKTSKNIWSIDGYVTDNGFDMSVVN